MTAKHKVVAVSTVLQNAQDRLNKIHSGIEKETNRRKVVLEKTNTTLQEPSSSSIS